MTTRLRRTLTLLAIPSLIAAGGLLGRLYALEESRAAKAEVRSLPANAGAQPEQAERTARELERMALRLRALEHEAASRATLDDDTRAALVAETLANVDAERVDAQPEAPTQTPEQWYQSVTAGKAFNPERARDVQHAATTLLSRPTLEGTRLENLECRGEACALRFRSNSPGDLAAFQTQLGERPAFENTTVLYSFDENTLSATLHLEPGRITVAGG